MCKKLFFLGVLVVLSLAAAPPAVQAQVENLVVNPSFEEDEAIQDDAAGEHWWTWNPAEGAGSVSFRRACKI